jgi:hypothetical protein
LIIITIFSLAFFGFLFPEELSQVRTMTHAPTPHLAPGLGHPYVLLAQALVRRLLVSTYIVFIMCKPSSRRPCTRLSSSSVPEPYGASLAPRPFPMPIPTHHPGPVDPDPGLRVRP